MPRNFKKQYKKFKRKFNRKRRNFKKRGKFNKQYTVLNVPKVMGDFPLPSRLRTKFVTEALLVKPAGASTGETYAFSGNSLYHPFDGVRITGAGVANGNNALTRTGGTGVLTALAPYGYTNLCTNVGPYTAYRVLASKIIVSIVPNDITNNITVATAPIQSFSAYLSMLAITSGAYMKTKVVTVGGSGVSAKLTNYVATARTTGVDPKNILINPNYSGAYNTAPVAEWFHQVIWITNSAAALIAPVTINVKVIYYVELYNVDEGQLTET